MNFPDATKEALEKLLSLIESLQSEELRNFARAPILAVGGSEVEAAALKAEEENRQQCEEILRERLATGRWPKMTPTEGALLHIRLMHICPLLEAMSVCRLVSYVDSDLLLWTLLTKGWEAIGLGGWKKDLSNRAIGYDYGFQQGGERSFGT